MDKSQYTNSWRFHNTYSPEAVEIKALFTLEVQQQFTQSVAGIHISFPPQ